jgi:hypothetical protein
MHCSIDTDDDHVFVGFLPHGVFNDRFAGAGLAHNHAESALLGMNFEGIRARNRL